MYRLFVLLFLPFVLTAQNEVSDPAATKILDRLSSFVKDAPDFKAEFQLVMNIAEMQEEVIDGSFAQQGKRFHMSVPMQEVINDGNQVFVIINNTKTVQKLTMDDFSSQMGMMNPFAVVDLYRSGEYIYAITGQGKINGKNYTQIEFKSNDRYAEYSKVRLAIDAKSSIPKYLKVFAKDGSNYTFTIESFLKNPSFDKSEFQFQSTKYSGYNIQE